MKTETAIEITKWASLLNHLKNNRIEYLLLVGIAHLLGITAEIYSRVDGVCL